MLKRRNNIVFVEDAHLYYVDNILVPSVTTILGATVFKDKYSSVPEFVLNRAAQFGSNVHRAIELHDIEGLNDKEIHCVIEYVKLIRELNITELEHEMLLAYNYDYAGTADLLLEYKGNQILADIKTTSKLDLEYLSWQLSMYAKALDFKGDLYAIWLNKKGVAEFHKVDRVSYEEIERVLIEYANHSA
jgi:hypothetical protein